MSNAERTVSRRRMLLALACGALVAHAALFAFVCDDAFISFRYARNLVEHGSLVFNLGERVEGYTNFLWTLLLAGVIRLGGDPAAWSRGLGIACGIGVLLVVARFQGRLHGARRVRDVLPALLLAASPAFACWCTGGLETQLFTLLVTLGWTTLWFEAHAPGRARPWSAAWFALAALTRPEGAFFFALAAVHRLLSSRVHQPVDYKRTLLWVGTFVVITLPYFVWRWSYYGAPLPNTYYAKVGGAFLWRSGWQDVSGWALHHPVLLLAALATGPMARRSDGDASPASRLLGLGGLALLYVVALGLHVAHAGGDFMALHRFMVPVMPLVACVAARGFELVAAALQRARVQRAAQWGLAACLALLVGLQVAALDRGALRVERQAGRDSIGLLRSFAAQWTAIGRWLAANAPAGTSIATTAAGCIPYYSRLPALDMLGLNDAWVARHVPPAPGNDAGHTRIAPPEYLIEKHVDCVIGHPLVTDREPRPVPQDLEFWNRNGYAWRTVQVPGMTPPWWGFWQRAR